MNIDEDNNIEMSRNDFVWLYFQYLKLTKNYKKVINFNLLPETLKFKLKKSKPNRAIHLVQFFKSILNNNDVDTYVYTVPNNLNSMEQLDIIGNEIFPFDIFSNVSTYFQTEAYFNDLIDQFLNYDNNLINDLTGLSQKNFDIIKKELIYLLKKYNRRTAVSYLFNLFNSINKNIIIEDLNPQQYKIP